MQPAVAGLEHQVVAPLGAGEAPQGAPVVQGDGDGAEALGDAGVRIDQGLLQLGERERPRNAGEVRAVRGSPAPREMAGGAFSLAEEITLPGLRVARHRSLRAGRVELAHVVRQRQDHVRRQREGRHLALALPENVRDVVFGQVADVVGLDQRRGPVRAQRVGAVAEGADLRELRRRDRGGRPLLPEPAPGKVAEALRPGGGRGQGQQGRRGQRAQGGRTAGKAGQGGVWEAQVDLVFPDRRLVGISGHLPRRSARA